MHRAKRKALSDTNNHVPTSQGDVVVNKGKSKLVRQSNDDGFQEGAIVRIKLKNILTYEEVEFLTGPSLNVIIGPNGTGKSAIVCAICLGLAGKTGWLGRASSPADFIRYGTDKGTIELELFNCDGDNYIIRREITRQDTRADSKWWVNGRSANQRTVEEKVARLNIQVGNLVQFLPQEKVADFARMTEQELLENTEKALRPEIYEIHQRLNGMGGEKHDFHKQIETLRADLETEVQKNARLETDVQNYKARKDFLDRVNLLKMKKPWLEYNDLKSTYNELRARRDAKIEELKKAEKGVEPFRARLEKVKKIKKKVDEELKKKTEKIQEYAKTVSYQSRHLGTLDDKIIEAKSELELKQKEEDKRQKRVEDLTSQLAALMVELTQFQEANEEQIMAEIQEVNEKTRRLMQSINGINQRGYGVSTEVNNLRRDVHDAQQELRNIQDVGNQRLEQLRRHHRHTYDAVIWLRKNQHKFKATIHEPMILCLHMVDPSHAKFVESHISPNDMRAFVCEDPDDLQLFMRIMRDEQKLKINAVKAPPQSVASFKPDYPIDNLRRFGFFSYLRDLFQCPESVMAYLCVLYAVHKIPVGDNTVRRNVEQVIRMHPELRQFYTPDVQYSIKKSKYDGAVSSRNTQLKDVMFLGSSIDTQREQKLLSDIQTLQKTLEDRENSYRDLQRQQQDLERELNGFREKKKELSRQKDQKKRLEQQIQTKKESVRRVEEEAVDMATEERATNRKISDTIKEKIDSLTTMHKNTELCFKVSMEKVGKSLQQSEVHNKLTEMDTQEREQLLHLQDMKREADTMKQVTDEAKENARIKYEEAKKATGGREQSPDVLQYFKRCPETVEEIDDEIHKLQARADSIFQIDEQVIQQFNAREKEIERMRAALAEKEEQEERMMQDVTEMRNQWLNPLKEIVERIDENFATLFSAMDCCGTVDLHVPDDQEAYSRYGVRIKVKFRDGEALRELTPFHQSGGERSVATVLYMMALQELATCPFRCVDEINQGMDPVNERKIFELVVQTVCKRSKSQYFLLTPKLLPDLSYADNMRVLCIHNGPQVMSHKEWNLRAFLHRGAQVIQ